MEVGKAWAKVLEFWRSPCGRHQCSPHCTSVLRAPRSFLHKQPTLCLPSCYSSFSISSTGSRKAVMPLLTGIAGSGKVAEPRPFPSPASSFSTGDNWSHPWQLMVELMFSKCCNIKVNPIQKGVLVIIKHIQKRNSLLLGRRCTEFNSWFGRLLCDLKWVT